MSEKSYLELNEKIAQIYNQMGYSDKPLYDYKDMDEDLMDYEGYSEYAKRFNLKKSDVLAIMKVITESAAYQRSSQKSMMATRSNTIIPPDNTDELKQNFKDSEALIQTRQTHAREVADIAEIISNALGLNVDFSDLIALGHDIGHTWNGHTGERILSSIARLNNCGYIVHNAMGAYILERENIIERAIEEVKQFNPKTKEEDIKEFMRYVIDGIVSHNGEGVVGKIIPREKTSEDMAEEIRRCFTEKGYDREIMPATMEGAVIRYADIIAYTRSDILDGFRLKDANGNKIIKEFDDDYLSIIGTTLARKNNFEQMLTLENKFLLELYGLSKKIKELTPSDTKVTTLEEKQELERTKKERELIEAKYEEFKQYKIEYAKRYINSIESQSDVKTKVTQMMQNVFIKDLIEASRDKGYITMSPLLRKTLFLLRDMNVRKIVPYTRRIFETQDLPIAAEGLTEMFTNVLLDTGMAYELIPKEVREDIKPYASEEEHKNNEEEINRNPHMNYERKMCHYYRKQNPEKLEYMYKNVIAAMEDITRHDVNIAIGKEKYEGELKEIYEANKINPIKKRIAIMGKNSETITDEDTEKLVQELLKDRKKDVEKAIAAKMAIEYIGGMTDNTILAVLIEKNLISRKQLIEGYSRPEPGKEALETGVRDLQRIFADNEAMIYPDDKRDDEITL